MIKTKQLTKYARFREQRIPFEEGNDILGWFSYHTSSLNGEGVENATGELKDKLESALADAGYYTDNKYTIVTEKFLAYIHDGYIRTGQLKNLTGYGGREPKPLLTSEWNKAIKLLEWPSNAYESKKEWKKDVNARAVKLKRAVKEMKTGSMYYEEEVRKWLDRFDDIYNKMRIK